MRNFHKFIQILLNPIELWSAASSYNYSFINLELSSFKAGSQGVVQFYHLGWNTTSVFMPLIMFSNDLSPQVSRSHGLRSVLNLPSSPQAMYSPPCSAKQHTGYFRGWGCRVSPRQGVAKPWNLLWGVEDPSFKLRGRAMPCWAGQTQGEQWGWRRRLGTATELGVWLPTPAHSARKKEKACWRCAGWTIPQVDHWEKWEEHRPPPQLPFPRKQCYANIKECKFLEGLDCIYFIIVFVASCIVPGT